MKRPFLALVEVVIVFGLLTTSCSYPNKVTQTPPAQAVPIPIAWIDSPLDAMEGPPGQYEIIAHGSDKDVITAVEVYINDVPLTNEQESNAPLPLVTVRNLWNAQTPGKYTIKVRAQNAKGEWSSPAIAEVWIIQEIPSPLPEIVLIPTLTPTTTLTPHPTITATMQAEYIKDVSISPEIVSFYSRCPPNQVQVETRAFDPDGIYVLALYYRLKDTNTGDVSDWYHASLDRVEGDLYRTIFTPVPSDHALALFLKPKLERGGASYSVQVQIQLVMHDLNQDIYRSNVFTDVTLYGCAPE